MKKIIFLGLIFLFIFLNGIISQHNHGCVHGPELSDVRVFDSAASRIIDQQMVLEEEIYVALHKASALIQAKDKLAAKELIDDELIPMITKYKSMAEKLHSLLFSGVSNIENTLRALVAVPRKIFDDSGLSWEEFVEPFYYTYETVINEMLNAHDELERFDVELVHIELVEDGSYLDDCDDNLVLGEITDEGNQNYPELDYLREVKECWQAHVLAFIVPATCDAAQGVANLSSLTNMQFGNLASTVRYDLVKAKSTVPVHEAFGHNLTLQHEDYFFDKNLNQVSVMFETYNPMFAGEFYSDISVSKLINAIPLMLSLADPTDLSIATDTSALELCEGETLLLEVSSNNGSLRGIAADELEINSSADGLLLTASQSGMYNFTIVAENDAYCYGVESNEMTIHILAKELRDSLVNLSSGDEFILADGTVVTETGTYTAIEAGAAENGCDIIWNYEVNVSTSNIDVEFENDVLIYPNPFDETLTIDTKESFQSINIYCMNGEKIYADLFTNRIDTKDLSKGLYIIELKGKRTENVILKVFKN